MSKPSNGKAGHQNMRIAIIGTGTVGATLARRLQDRGDELLLGTRNPAEAQALAAETGAEALLPEIAAAQADIIILAIPWRAVQEMISTLGDIGEAIVVDCINPLAMIDGQLALAVGHGTSAGEMIADWLPEARVVKTLNQVGAEIMAYPSVLPHRPAMFMAGDDVGAKRIVGDLLDYLGFQPIDAGGIHKSRLLEPLAMLWIDQATYQGRGREWAFCAVGADENDSKV